ncbi:MAG: LysE family transporter [Methanoregula sp.]|nr:LysE family transporter [Methanoregula sp.]
MYDVIQVFTLAFALGLTGALAPGPTFVATVNASIAGGWTTGPKVMLGHMIAELAIFILIVFGLATVALPYTPVITVIGGIALIAFGALTLSGSRGASIQNTSSGIVTNPYLAGFVTSLANPYFWLWWLSIGSAMVIAGLEGGIVLAGIFMIGHWCADLGWYTLVSYGISRGTVFLSDRTYRVIMALCGIFLLVFGAYYLSRFFMPA